MNDELQTEVVEQETVQDANDAFDSGFDGTPTVTPERKEPVDEPKYRSITEDEYSNLIKTAAAIDEVKATAEKQLSTAFGKIGGIERHLQQMQSQTPNGQPVEITADDVADMAVEFPELAELQLKAFQKVASKMRGTSGMDEGRLQQAIQQSSAQVGDMAVERAKKEIAAETLAETHPNWDQVVGLPDPQGNAPDNEFRRWLDTQPEDYKGKVLSTYSPVVIGKAIDKFNDNIKQKNDATRRNRFADAVTPKGERGKAPAPDDDDEFNAGFNSR